MGWRRNMGGKSDVYGSKSKSSYSCDYYHCVLPRQHSLLWSGSVHLLVFRHILGDVLLIHTGPCVSLLICLYFVLLLNGLLTHGCRVPRLKELGRGARWQFSCFIWATVGPDKKCWNAKSPSQIKPWKVIFGHFIDFGHFPIEIPIAVGKNYLHGKERSQSKNKNSSEICEQSRSTWQHAQFKMSNFSE